MAVMNNKSPVLPVQPCCSLVTSHKLLLFHEDNQTKFLRCLASCDVVSVAYIKYDPQFTKFLLLEFIKSESETPWLLYFQTGYECKRFTEALSKAVFDASQIVLPVDVLVDEVLRTRVSQCLSAIKASQKNVIRIDNKEHGKGK